MNEQPKYTSACLEAEQLVAWFDEALPLEIARKVQMHLETCAYCTRHVNELLEERQQVFDLLAQLDPPSMKRTTPTTVALARFQEHVSLSGNNSLPRKSTPFTQLRRQRPRFSRLAMQALVAALIVAVLVGTILSLLIPHVASPGASLKPFSPLNTTPVRVHTEAGGLSMSMQITAGPYFLNEMLQVDLSISNHSTTTYTMLEGAAPRQEDPCTPLLDVAMQGGVLPSNTALEQNLSTVFCIGLHLRVNNGPTLSLRPGNKFTARRYVVLTRSGHIQITTQAWFVRMGIQRNAKVWIPASTPLTGHWPTIQLDVSAHVPAQHNLLLKQQTTSVTVVAPPTTHPQLLYIELLDCLPVASGFSRSSVPYWIPLPAGISTLQARSLCTLSHSRLSSWTYIIGAPGFVTQSGIYRPKT